MTYALNDKLTVTLQCAISCCLNIYYGSQWQEAAGSSLTDLYASALYAYSPEAFPSAHRTTGGGIAVGWNRIMGIESDNPAFRLTKS